MHKLLSLLICLCSISLAAQNSLDQLVVWTASYDKASSSLNIEAELKTDWVIYSQHTDPEGPIPLQFDFDDNEAVEFIGEVEELTTPIIKHSEMFGVEVMKFKDKASFRQKIELKSEAALIKGYVTFMTCDSQKCLPPRTIPFEVKI